MTKRGLHTSLLMIGLALGEQKAYADGAPHPADSTHHLEAVEITAEQSLRTASSNATTARTILSPLQIRRLDITDLTTLTSRIPNLYIPDYGSRRSAAIYLRGVGSRSSGQTIGFYVDGIPYINKASFNFDLLGVKQVEVLRGPQGTLYGRNAMAGAINLYTLSALDGDRSEVRLRAGNHGQKALQAVGLMKLGNHWGAMLGVSGAIRDGYWMNITRGAKHDSLRTGEITAKIEYRPSTRFSSDLSVRYTNTQQGAFPYRIISKTGGELLPLSSGDPGEYKREDLSAGLRLKWQGNSWALVSATGYQLLRDKTAMDMDASPAKLFHVVQTTREYAITEEIVLRNRRESDRYQWTMGAFGFYDDSRLTAPVVLQTGGIRTLVQAQFDKVNAQRDKIADPTKRPPYLLVDATQDVVNANNFKKPEWGIALYHESTLRDFLFDGLTATLGLRLDYSHQQIDWDSSLGFRLGLSPTGANGPFRWVSKPTHLVGDGSQSSLQLLPKLTLQYQTGGWTIQTTASKGFKSGGYNEQTLTDIIQRAQGQDLQSLFGGKPYDATGLDHQLAYAPETAWSYELGIRHRGIGILQHLEVDLYYMDVRGLQLTRFVASGTGREISNAGRSYTIGAELSARLKLADILTANVAYGYTHARFGRGSSVSGTSVEGNHVPFIPSHTYSIILSAHETVSHSFIDSYYADLEVQGLGRMYWDERNLYTRNHYTMLGGRLGLTIGKFGLSLWGKNLLNTAYTAFQFQLMGNTISQQGAPRTMGIDLSWKF